MPDQIFKTELGSDLDRACDWLRRDELAAVPTETVYGLAANALHDRAVAKVFAAKERPQFDPLIVHLSPESEDWRNGKFTKLSDFSKLALTRIDSLAEKFWPGPLTLVLPKTDAIPDLVTSGLPQVALRKPKHPLTQKILKQLPFPLAAPSANRFGRISPTTANAVLAELDTRIPYILDGGPCAVGVESTVLLVEADGVVRLLRPGGATSEKIESCLGAPLLRGNTPSQNAVSPGTLESHYAPRKPLFLLDSLFDPRAKKIAILALTSELEAKIRADLASVEVRDEFIIDVRVLTRASDWSEVARGLFTAMRELDLGSADLIISALPPTPWSGLQFAVSDRLQRAATPR